MKSRVLLFFILISYVQGIHAQGNQESTGLQFDSAVQMPYDRYLQPAGTQVTFGDPALENHALDCSLSKDGSWLAIEARNSIEIYSIAESKIIFEYAMTDFPGVHDLNNCYSGITWEVIDNHHFVFWTAQSRRYNISYLIMAEWDGSKMVISKYFPYTALPPAEKSLANEFIISPESGNYYLYVVLNGNNQIIKQSLENRDTVWIQPTGVAPYGIVKCANRLYVTNWGGRIPDPGDKNVAGVPWGEARVDPRTGATREGSVSVIDMNTGKTIKEIMVGLHPNEIISDRRGEYVYVTNSNSDNVSVISTATNEVSETIPVRLDPTNNPFFGDSPDGLALSVNQKTLYVANGMDNALAVINLGKNACSRSKLTESSVAGFIPTAAYPSGISVSKNRQLYVCNLESEGADVRYTKDSGRVEAFNSHHMWASVSVIGVPGKKQLDNYTNSVIALNQLSRLAQTKLKPREDVKPVPVPERIGEPSVFKHVLYIIKENRTYDQVLGDMKEGNGSEELCNFGREVTPNTHKIVKDFVLMDNFYVSGKCSAEGHQWTDASIVSDYIEKNMRAWFRSYPHVQKDALVYSPTGFIWDNAIKYGKSVRIYGEASSPVFDNSLKWKDVYNDFLTGKPFQFTNETAIAPVRGILDPNYPAFDSHTIPDVLRAAAFIKELKNYESMPGDQLPQLMIMALPADHTAGMRPDYPRPKSMVADNDLALGRIVEALSHSRFWENTAIFVVEDDSQDGWDHVSAYRTVCMVISPYSRIPETVHTRYDQPSIVRTIEQILGMQPMNIQDALATPMFDCFTGKKDLAGYESVPNLTPLDDMNPSLSGLNGKALKFAKISMESQFDHIDSGNDDLLNRIIWYATMNNIPYPSKFAGSDLDEDEK